MRFPVTNYVKIKSPDWSKDATIYQVNTRQFSEQGTFREVTKALPRIKALGSDIIWLMPIHEIGHKNRKGSLGSPYAVKDFYSVNSEFGSEQDLKMLIDTAHAIGLKVILDWVPNHTAWDNNLVENHPDWYARDYKGDFRPSPWWDWDDIIELDYNNSDLRAYMIDALCYWVKTFDIDGYRCDVAGYVPNDFWQQVRQSLDEIKPVFMLAEWEDRDMHEHGFDMTYAWSWNEVMFGIATGDLPLDKLRKYYSWNERAWPQEAYRMTFVSNHDENAWEGTPDEKFGPMLPAAIVLSVIGEGMPLIHNGQEAGETKRLAFFERDPIEWQPHFMHDFYKTLLRLRKSHTALWNGKHGARMHQVPNTQMNKVLSFVREDNQSKWFCVFNFSADTLEVSFAEQYYVDAYDAQLHAKGHQYTQQHFDLALGQSIELGAWEYRIFVKHYDEEE
ncbi:alpha-amylase family glycosyl hydrolase [Glaciecola siphonariae]|uniref:Alpha-amylase family glycosyl hydrolase n=1 Tax=Glaciecola siphonariae TaxID=521012 RepID=A0ABV9M1G5_9ALTE